MWVVSSIIVANVAFFFLMIGSGVDAEHPGAAALTRWGANSGLTTLVGHQPWRILSCTFIHAGFGHLFFNMIALANAGFMIERIFGAARLGAIYFCAAVAGSIASLEVHPQIISVGASGAIFGLYGALAAFVAQERGTVPAPVIRALSGIALPFIGYNLSYGLQDPNIDAAAHVGGLLGARRRRVVVGVPSISNRGRRGAQEFWAPSACRWRLS